MVDSEGALREREAQIGSRWSGAEAEPEPQRHGRLRFLRNPLTAAGLLLMIAITAVAVLAPWVAPYDPLAQDLGSRLAPPSAAHPLGADPFGRDILSRVIWGARISLAASVGVVAASALIGTLVGIVAGFVGGLADEVLMRLTDAVFAFPSLILAMAIAAILGPSLTNALIAVAVVSWPVYARIARARALVIREQEYIEAARALGNPSWRIMLRHVLPNAFPAILVQATVDTGLILLVTSGLSFIGFGAQPPSPEWGLMVSEGRSYIVNEWWVSTFPGLAIFAAATAFNLLGDGLRDLWDPRG